MRTKHVRNTFETLEPRRLYSVTLGDDGILTVVGTSHADHVVVALDPADSSLLTVDVNGAPQSFDAASVVGINANLGGGNDTFTIDESNATIDVPATILGGAGNDSISGGSGNDSNSASVGNDTVVGGAGDDTIDGGAGRDLLDGGGDADSLVGGTGPDQLNGNAGDDDLNGGGGTNKVTGGAGADAFASNTGGKNTITDSTPGEDHQYQAFSIDRIPPKYVLLFNSTFPNSEPVGYRLNDDHSFTMLYRFNGDSLTYHAYFTYPQGAADPFADFDQINLVKYEVAPTNLPPNTLADFRSKYPDGTIMQVYADHGDNGKFGMIRLKVGDEESQWIEQDWLDND